MTEQHATQQMAPESADTADSDLIAFLNDVPVLAARLDAKCCYQQANRTYVEMFGFTQQSIIGLHVSDVLTHAGWDKVRPHIEEVLSGKAVSYETLLPFRQGMRFAHINYTPHLDRNGTVIGFYVVALDIHEVVLAQRVSAQRAHDLHLVLDHLPALVASFDRDGRYLALNQAYRQAFNLEPGRDYRGQQIKDIVGPTAWSVISPQIEQVLSGRTVMFDAVLEFSSGLRHVRVSYVPEHGDPLRCSRFFALIVDREKEYLDALAIRQSEEQLRTTLNSIGDAVVSTDTFGRVARMNAVAERLTGWSQSEVVGRHITDVLHLVQESDRSPVVNPVDTVMLTGGVVGITNHAILVARDGSERVIDDCAAPILSEAGELQGVVMVFRDVTRERELQAQLRQNEKLQAIGQLAGGIAHDFNNFLGGILGAAQLISLRAGETLDAKGIELLELIKSTAFRASDLTGKLMAFARKANHTFGTTDVAEVIRDSIKILQHTIDKNVSIRFEDDGAAGSVHGNSSALQSALLNIGINAWHAMPQGGEIVIGLSRCHVTEVSCELAMFKLQPGWFAEINIADTGIGIAPEHLPKIFEPFFTTKALGVGTGLGLAAVYGTVLDHRGAIQVHSEIGRGTTFRLLLPESTAVAPPVVAAKEAPLKGTRRTILLVDDEPMLLAVLRGMLHALGYDVVTASDGQSALETFRREQHVIDLVITDLNLPVLNGAEVIAQIRAIRPDCRFMVSTGYSDASVIEMVDRLGVCSVLRKPYTIETLDEALAKVFD